MVSYLTGWQIEGNKGLLVLLGDYRLSMHRDERNWRWNNTGQFTVKSYYTFLSQ